MEKLKKRKEVTLTSKLSANNARQHQVLLVADFLVLVSQVNFQSPEKLHSSQLPENHRKILRCFWDFMLQIYDNVF